MKTLTRHIALKDQTVPSSLAETYVYNDFSWPALSGLIDWVTFFTNCHILSLIPRYIAIWLYHAWKTRRTSALFQVFVANTSYVFAVQELRASHSKSWEHYGWRIQLASSLCSDCCFCDSVLRHSQRYQIQRKGKLHQNANCWQQNLIHDRFLISPFMEFSKCLWLVLLH